MGIFQSTHPVWGATYNSGMPDTDQPQFQSTHPVWGATLLLQIYRGGVENFNPRTPCGVRRAAGRVNGLPHKFQSTHPVWGATPHCKLVEYMRMQFQSTHPVWGATSRAGLIDQLEYISIHAPRVGCDPCLSAGAHHRMYFNPRTPCGVRPLPASGQGPRPGDFNPRTPCGVRLQSEAATADGGEDFNPRTPCGVRLVDFFQLSASKRFQSTHPVWGATREVQLR